MNIEKFIFRTVAVLALLAMSILPVAIYGLFHVDSFVYPVAQFVFNVR